MPLFVHNNWLYPKALSLTEIKKKIMLCTNNNTLYSTVQLTLTMEQAYILYMYICVCERERDFISSLISYLFL